MHPPANARPAGGSQSVRPLFSGIATCSRPHAQLFRVNGPLVPMPGDTFSPPLLLTGPNGRRKGPRSTALARHWSCAERPPPVGLRPTGPGKYHYRGVLQTDSPFTV